jgi:cobyrinic acid a,c-diamide synthase
LAAADVVVYDALVDAAILSMTREGAVLEYAGKRGGQPSAVQADISERLIALARQGLRVLRLKGGDPFVFGRGGEEALALAQAGIPFRIIPGVSSGLASLAIHGVPATTRATNHAVVLATGHCAADGSTDWAALARTGAPLVLYMAVTNLPEIVEALIGGGLPGSTPALVVHGATTARERVVEATLERLPGWRKPAGSAPPRWWPSGPSRPSGRHRQPPAGIRRGGGAVTAPATPGAPGLLVAAPRSGSGKTTVVLGLQRALRRRGLDVRGAKCGPDYIDPAFHAAATGRPSFNLDSFAMDDALLSGLAGQATAGADLVIAEGSMGLFDGVRRETGRTGASADVAALMGWPVILVLDVSGHAQSAAAVALGCARFDPRIAIAGVILNKVASERHRRLVEDGMNRVGLPVLGALMRDQSLALPERHLGLVQAGETAELEARLDALADSGGARRRPRPDRGVGEPHPPSAGGAPGVAIPPPGGRIALASDAAFSFVYPHVLAGWRAAGAEIEIFSPLADEPPPEGCDACWLPGGYPELHAGLLGGARRFSTGFAPLRRRARSTGSAGATWCWARPWRTPTGWRTPWRGSCPSRRATPRASSTSATGSPGSSTTGRWVPRDAASSATSSTTPPSRRASSPEMRRSPT